MDIRQSHNARDVKGYDTERLREDFLIDNLFTPNEIKLTYCHDDRMIVGSACPVNPLTLPAGVELKAEYFLERRELGILNLGGPGSVIADGKTLNCLQNECVYIGMGTREVTFTSDDPQNPAAFYLASTPAHATYPTTKVALTDAAPVSLGSQAECNKRTIRKYIHPQGVKSCQLVMGMTALDEGSVWNTMPCHTHERRMEVYLYCDMAPDALVFHYMGEPTQTRHIVMRNRQAVISPSWSIHSGCGTRNYSFVWAMAGENQVFSDMDAVNIATIA